MGTKRLGIRDKDSSMAQSVAQAAAVDEHAGAGHLEEIPVEKVIGNERNPRFQAVTPDQVRQLRADALAAVGEGDDSNREAFFEAVSNRIEELELPETDHLTASDCRGRLNGIAALAHSINRLNLIQPIVVYPVESGYEVLAGQRRFLAHLLLGRNEIRALVRQPTGDPLDDNLAAVVENLSREELSLRERVEAIEEIVKLHEERTDSTMNAAALQEYLGESRRTCQRYLRILRESAVREGIRSGEVTSLRQASQLVEPSGSSEDADGGANGSSGRLTRSAPVSHSETESQAGQGTSRKKRAARPKTRVTLGFVQDCSQVRRLMAGYLGEEALAAQFPDVDWSDFNDVEQAWKRFWGDYIVAEADE